jgi:hypothetical protein
MAFGIFGAAALQRLPLAGAVTAPLALLVALAWGLLALVILLALHRHGIAAYSADRLASFGIGTWVAGTAVVARLMMLALPALPLLAEGFFWLGLALWLWFMPLALANLLYLAKTPGENGANGIILLTTVATQSVAVIALRLFGGFAAVRAIGAALIGLGAAAYLAGLWLIARRYHGYSLRPLLQRWDNSNCILHGAISITGLAAVLSGAFPAPAVLGCWLAAALAFVVVEIIEAARLAERWRRLGWRRALFAYDVSQWARNFTFGMFYAFSLAFAEQTALAGAHPLLSRIRDAVLAYGQYVVLALLLAQSLVLLSWLCSRQR